MTTLSFHPTVFTLIITAAACAVFGTIAVHNLRYSHERKYDSRLELIRILTVVMLLLTMFQPELVKRQIRHRKPVAAILHDISGSMNTEDVEGDGLLISRAACVQKKLDEHFYQPLEQRFDVKLTAFSGNDARTDGTDISTVLLTAAETLADLRAVLLITDGDWNVGPDPLGAALKLRERGIPVYAVAAGAEKYLPDLCIDEVNAPAYGMVNEKILIPFSVTSHLSHETVAAAALRAPSGVVAERQVRIAPGATAHASVIWQPKAAGTYQLKLKIPAQAGEIRQDNNEYEFTMEVRDVQLRVLLVEGLPRWEYRYLRNALIRDPGVDVHTVLFHQTGMLPAEGAHYLPAFPAEREALDPYDVVFIGDIGIAEGELTEAQAEMLRALVHNQGSGLVFLPGRRGRHLSLLDSPLGDLYPVQLDRGHMEGHGFRVEARPVLTSEGSDHLLTMLSDNPSMNVKLWKQLPGFYWHAPALLARPGAHVLAVHPTSRSGAGRVPLLATRPSGNGHVLFMGTDSAWRWRRGVEDQYHYRFWAQVVRWMAHKRHLAYSDRLRLFLSPETPVRGDTVHVRAAMTATALAVAAGKDLVCRMKDPGGHVQQIRLVPEEASDGEVFVGEISTARPGKHWISVQSLGGGLSFETEFEVADSTIEKIGVPGRHQVLHELASLTSGRFARVGELDTIIAEINRLPERSVIETRIRLWSQWWWGAVIVGLLTVYWIMRKVAGRI